MVHIGPFTLTAPAVLAPMAGVTDLPFRALCRQYGAALTPSEMVTSDVRLWNSTKSRQRLRHEADESPCVVQIVGYDATMLAEAARQQVEMGAEIVDINMGCPAKKVCKRAAGSALLRDEALVTDILTAVVGAVDVPVTLKIRTGWSPEERNGVTIARLAEQAGIASLAVHGRTRACRFKGQAEYDTIAAIVEAVSIPVFANGDVDSPEKARQVLDHTGAAGIMIGRAAQGQPWLFAAINQYLQHGTLPPAPSSGDICTVMHRHVAAIHRFHGDYLGTRIARKHVGWYLNTLAGAGDTLAGTGQNAQHDGIMDNNTGLSREFNRLESPTEQSDWLLRLPELLAQQPREAA